MYRFKYTKGGEMFKMSLKKKKNIYIEFGQILGSELVWEFFRAPLYFLLF